MHRTTIRFQCFETLRKAITVEQIKQEIPPLVINITIRYEVKNVFMELNAH